MTFLEKYGIHKSYEPFFTKEKQIEFNKIKEKLKQTTPDEAVWFRALQTDINQAKILILGQDPYPQSNVATGLAFQVDINSWDSKKVNTSLKNILKLLYKSYFFETASILEIRTAIKEGKFKVRSPYDLFESWQQQGVILLNIALTTQIGCAGAHLELWRRFMESLLAYITTKNTKITVFLWGSKVKRFKKNLFSDTIHESNHPAIVGKIANSQDFLNSLCFNATKQSVNWLGD